MINNRLEGRPLSISPHDRNIPIVETERPRIRPGHVFVTPDGNGTEAHMLALEALSGNQESVEEVYRRISLLHELAQPYIASDPQIEQFYREKLEEPFAHVHDIPFPTLIQKLDEKKVLPLLGHVRGAEITPDLTDALREKYPDIKILSMWGLSDSNIESRPPQEVAGLMWLMDYQIKAYLPRMREKKIHFKHIGNRLLLPSYLLETIEMAEEETRSNDGQTFALGLGFGGRDSVRRLVDAARRYGVSPDEEPTTDEFIARFLDGEGEIPPADLTIRTNGLTRLSNPGLLIIGDGTEHYAIEAPYPRSVFDDYSKAVEYFGTVKRTFGGRPEVKAQV